MIDYSSLCVMTTIADAHTKERHVSLGQASREHVFAQAVWNRIAEKSVFVPGDPFYI